MESHQEHVMQSWSPIATTRGRIPDATAQPAAVFNERPLAGEKKQIGPYYNDATAQPAARLAARA